MDTIMKNISQNDDYNTEGNIDLMGMNIRSQVDLDNSDYSDPQ